MAEILLCNQQYRLDSLEALCGIYPDHVMDINGGPPSMLVPYRPYLLNEELSGTDRSILLIMNHTHISRTVTDMALAYGGNNTVGIAEIAEKLRKSGIGVTGATTSVYAKRMEGFVGAVQDYQDALLGYRDTVKSNPASRAAAEQKVHAASRNMNKGFRNELSVVNSRIHAHRGTPLGSSKRAVNIARGSHNIAKLKVVNEIQATNLVKLAKYGKFLGQGLTVIDFGSRVGTVKNSFDSGGNWERDMFVESSSFAASAVAGILAVKVGAAGLACLVAVTPAGWVLIIAGLAVAGAAAGTSIFVNQTTKERSGAIYDSIMNWLGSL